MNNGKICVSVCAATADELIEQIRRAEDLADVIEIRFDCLNESEMERTRFAPILEQIKQTRSKIPVLATYRPKEQGGKRELTQHERGNFFRYLNSFEIADFEDIEVDMAFLFEHDSLTRLTPVHSFHDFAGVPDDLERIFEKLSQSSKIVKIAVQTDDITDTISIWKLLERAKAGNRQITPIAM